MCLNLIRITDPGPNVFPANADAVLWLDTFVFCIFLVALGCKAAYSKEVVLLAQSF